MTRTGIAVSIIALAALALLGTRVAARANPSPRPVAKPTLPMAPSSIRAEGQFVAYPGAEVTISSEIEGRIIELPVDEKSVVTKGQLLVALDPKETAAQLAEARAHIEEENAEVTATAA